MHSLLLAYQQFWRQHPALLYALAVLLGIWSVLDWTPLLLLPMLMIAIPLLLHKDGLRGRLALACVLATCAAAFVSIKYRFPEIPQEGISGNALIEFTSLSSSTTHFGKRWLYKGTIKQFDEGPVSARNIPFSLSLPQNEEMIRPPADQAYWVMGRLKEQPGGRYSLNVAKDTPWFPIKGTWSLAEYRFRVKQYVSDYIQRKMSSARVATFLAGIATGDFDDRLMQFEFSRFGLQHIMAISGFHFAIVAGILSLLLRLVMNKHRATLLLIFLLSSYFIFLGCGPSIMRAWMTVLIALCGFLFARRGSGLNSLGVAMLMILLFDPLQCRSIGFQFSFATTTAILLLYFGCDQLMQQVIVKRPLSQMVEMDFWNQHAYCVLAFFRQAFAMAVAVNLIALPMMLYYFHKFPVLSLVYNLFFPFMVSISMLLLLLGILIGIVLPPLGDVVHYINDRYTHFMLNFTYNMPTNLDVTWRVADLSLWLVVCHLCVMFTFGIYMKYLLEQKQESYQDFAFI
jgi:competence protein ComEC